MSDEDIIAALLVIIRAQCKPTAEQMRIIREAERRIDGE